MLQYPAGHSSDFDTRSNPPPRAAVRSLQYPAGHSSDFDDVNPPTADQRTLLKLQYPAGHSSDFDERVHLPMIQRCQTLPGLCRFSTPQGIPQISTWYTPGRHRPSLRTVRFSTPQGIPQISTCFDICTNPPVDYSCPLQYPAGHSSDFDPMAQESMFNGRGTMFFRRFSTPQGIPQISTGAVGFAGCVT